MIYRLEIIYDIGNKLKSDYKDIDSPEEIVEQSNESIVASRVREAEQKKDTEANGNIRRIKDLHNQQIRQVYEERFSDGIVSGALEKGQDVYKRILEGADKAIRVRHICAWLSRLAFWFVPLIIGLGLTYLVRIFINSHQVITDSQLRISIRAWVDSASFMLGSVFSFGMNLFKGDFYNKLKKATDKDYLKGKYIESECERLGIKIPEE